MPEAALEFIHASPADLAHIELVACDIDGTLVTAGQPAAERTIAAIAAAREAGIAVVIATGRQVRSASLYAHSCGIVDAPMVCYQGAVVAYPDTPVEVWPLHMPLPVEIALDVIARYGASHHINAYINDTVCCAAYTDAARIYESITKVPVRVVGDLPAYVREHGTTKAIVFAPDSAARDQLVDDMRGAFGERAWVTHSLPQFAEVCNAGASKAVGLQRVCDELGVAMEHTAACGDGNNDLQMLDAAALAAVPSTANVEVRAHADVILPGPEEFGVATFLEEIIAARMRTNCGDRGGTKSTRVVVTQDATP